MTHTLQAAKIESDTKLIQVVQEKCSLTEQMNTAMMRNSKEVEKLKEKITELQNPLNRGNSGEFDTAQTLRDIGFHVDDTSEGEKKDTGYLDLLVRPDSSTVSNMRIAIEVKNKKTIKKASDEKARDVSRPRETQEQSESGEPSD